jgi:hypothetical protein
MMKCADVDNFVGNDFEIMELKKSEITSKSSSLLTFFPWTPSLSAIAMHFFSGITRNQCLFCLFRKSWIMFTFIPWFTAITSELVISSYVILSIARISQPTNKGAY